MADRSRHSSRRSDAELRDLLIQRATGGITPKQAARLDGLLGRSLDKDTECWDRAAAAVSLAAMPATEAMPAALRRRLIGDAVRALRPDGSSKQPASGEEDAAD